MHELYGTYLIHLVEKTLRDSELPLSAREVAQHIRKYPTYRERNNFLIRVRRALNLLTEDGHLLKEKHRIHHNLVCFKYKFIQHEQKSEIS